MALDKIVQISIVGFLGTALLFAMYLKQTDLALGIFGVLGGFLGNEVVSTVTTTNDETA